MSDDYSVEDKGLLVAPMKRLVWGPLLKRLPRSVSANAMTLTGTAINLAAFTIALLVTPSSLSMAVIAALVFVYLCLDNMDGAQARRTGTGSPLGEFLDHWLDGINSTYLTLGGVVSWESRNLAGLLAVALTSVTYSTTYWEQRATGRMYFAVLGNVEGIVAVVLLFAAQAVIGPHTVAKYPIALGFSVTDFIIGLTVVTGTVTSIAAVARVGRRLHEVLWILSVPATLVAWYWLSSPPFVPLALLLVLTTPATGGRMLAARVTKRRDLGPDLAMIVPVIAAAAACVFSGAPPSTERIVLDGLIIYAIAKDVFEFQDNIRRLAHHIRPGELLSIVFEPKGREP